MKAFNPWLLLALAGSWPGAAPAQLQLLPDKEPQCVFSGEAQPIAVVWHNAGNKTADADIRARILQTSSATAVQLSEVAWKKLQMLPQQTILESARLDFPMVKAETKFLIQWLENTNRVIGVTEVRAYPTNLLAELKPLATDQSFGVFDPQDELKPLLRNCGVDFIDLGNSELEYFPGKLAVIGPFKSQARVPDGMAKRIKTLALKGVAVVWLLPPMPDEKPQPSFYLVSDGQGTIVVVQTGLVSDLLANPKSQLNLLYFCELALNPQPPPLPGFSPENSKDWQGKFIR